ncbi:MAG TPA: GntR family transcriptional regulator [Thermomicrobiales bacterium]|jgi:DNA-binding GntR family transcriptional regulator
MQRARDQFQLVEEAQRTLHARIATNVREAIVRGELRPGERLKTEEIARQFGISRIPVREALHSLVAEGFVTLSPQRGAFVADLSVEDIEEIYLLRCLLEPVAARLAVANLTPELVERLVKIVEEMESSEGDQTRWMDLDRSFHLTLYAASGRPRLYRIIAQLRANSERYTAIYIASPEYLPGARTRHRELLEAYLRADADLAEQRTHQHLQEIERFFIAELRGRLQGESDQPAPAAGPNDRVAPV